MRNESVSIIISGLVGVLSFLVGGFDSILIALLVVMGSDWLTGVLSSLKLGKFSPIIGLWGVVNKIVALIVIATINFIQQALSLPIPLRETLVAILLINEGLSVLRNSSTFVKGLEPFSKYFENFKVNILKVFTVVGVEDEK